MSACIYMYMYMYVFTNSWVKDINGTYYKKLSKCIDNINEKRYDYTSLYHTAGNFDEH